MKKVIFAIAFAPLAFYGCKKSEPTGSQYTEQMAGTRGYRHYSSVWQGGIHTETNDTVAAEIKYVNRLSIQFNSTTLTYSQEKSNDSVLVFVDPSLDQRSHGTLTYERMTNKIGYSTYIYVGSGGNVTTEYSSL